MLRPRQARETIQTVVTEQRGVSGGTRATLQLRAGELVIPGVLQVPAVTPAPAALLLHGFSLRKEIMADSVGGALLRHGVASLALDLPMHGSRGDPFELQSMRNPAEAVRLWRLALREGALAVRALREQPELQPDRLGVVGYSLGAFISVMLAASEPHLRAVVLAAGGDLPLGTPLTALARTVADPVRAVRKLGGRPLLMLHGRQDPVISPSQAERLFEAAGEPKELRWWNAGHTLPQAAIEDAAAWLARQLRPQGT